MTKTVAALLTSLLLLIAASAFSQQAPRGPRPAPPPANTDTARLGDPFPGLTNAQRAAFNNGSAEFAAIEAVSDGLGPVFNGRSCAECHRAPAPGGGSNRLVTRFGTITAGAFDPLTQFGGSLIQEHAIGPRDGSVHPFTPERVPAAATIVTRRRTTPLFGLGLVDATPDVAFLALAQQQAARNDGTAGRVNLVQNISAGMATAGKFGWKAQVPSLFQFAGDAYLNEMGITNPQFPSENCPSGNCTELAFNPRPDLNDLGDGVRKLADFMTLLAAPPRGPITQDVSDGETVFNSLGCNSCHVATLQSGPSPVAALDRKTYHPYSDFLLHDMGSLGDGIVQGDSRGREMRTAPLWGLRAINTFLHDGRANTLDQAILAHDGQARTSRDRFANLDSADRAKLMAFLQSL
ncbi:MAG TPA: di-heme oxidoredictase family protein [Thermoanaerobaculia bacterium]|nr:di-heme oxidoredictase family protein [Thermoanaerobaculia bacterium]